MLFHPRPRQCYVVAATPRSGSNYLCQLLASTGMLGVPREYFNAPGRRAYDDPRYPEHLRGQVRQILTTGATPNGICGVKIHAYQVRNHAGDPLGRLARRCPVIAVRLHRDDWLGQAISWTRAQQTQQFRAGDPEAAPPAYSRAAIDAARTDLADQAAWWDLELARRGWPVIDVGYENLMSNAGAEVARIGARLGVDAVTLRPEEVTVRVQRDGVNAQWRADYLDGT